jgi:hypothetical protein
MREYGSVPQPACHEKAHRILKHLIVDLIMKYNSIDVPWVVIGEKIRTKVAAESTLSLNLAKKTLTVFIEQI